MVKNNSGQLRLGLSEVIQMMMPTAQELGAAVMGAGEWPGIAWTLMQLEADGQTRVEIAGSLGIEEQDIADLLSDLIQCDKEDVPDQVWRVGVVALKTSRMSVNQVIGTTWDQLEAMAIERLAAQLAALPPGVGDPEKMLAIAKTANSATRRQAGEGRPGSGIGQSSHQRMGAGPAVDIEMQSGDIGSITLRFSARVREQLGNPNRIIDGEARAVPAGAGLERLRLKEVRPLVEEYTESEKAEQAEQASLAQSQREQKAQTKTAKKAEEMSRLEDMFGINEVLGGLDSNNAK